MNLKKFIDQLQALYDEEIKHVDVMGEPEIVIDIFYQDNPRGPFKYGGFTTEDIKIERSGDGAYNVLSAFGDSYAKHVRGEL